MRPLKLRLQAFGSYAEEQVLDFEHSLADSPFVLIHGATGAGKTTILDAIVFALYGESSGDVREGAMLRSSTAPPERATEVEYVFALGRRRYRVLRSPSYERMSRGKMTKRAATGQLYRLPDEGEHGEETLLDSNVTEVSKRIGQLIGFDADQFRQVVLLPQGQFQRFLLAEVKDRSAIMQRIFRTERYQRLEEALTQEALMLERAFEEERGRMEQLLHTEDAASLEELSVRIEQLRTDTESSAEKLRALEQQQKDARRAREEGALTEKKLHEAQETHIHLEEKRAQGASVQDFRMRLARAVQANPVLRREREALQAAAQEKRSREESAAAEEIYQHARTTLNAAQEKRKSAETQEPERLRMAAHIQELSSLRARVQQLDACCQAVEHLRIQTTQTEQEKQADAEKFMELSAIHKENEERGTALEKILASAEAVHHEEELLVRCQNIMKDIEGLRAQLSNTEGKERSAQEALKAATDALASARTRLRQMQMLYDLGSAARLAEMLTNDAPCPVCGALTHPAPAVHAEDIPSVQEVDACAQAEADAEQTIRVRTSAAETAKAEYARIQQELAHSEKLLAEFLGTDTVEQLAQRVHVRGAELRRAEEEHRMLIHTLDTQRRQIEVMTAEQTRREEKEQADRDLLRTREGELAALEAQVPQEYRDSTYLAAEICRLQQAVEVQKEAYRAAQQQEQDAVSSFARAETAQAAAQRAAKEALHLLQTAQTAYEEARVQAGFPTEEEYHAAVEGRWSEDAYLETVRQRISAYDTEFRAMEALAQKAQEAAAGLLPPNMNALIEAERMADEAVREGAREQGIRMERLNGLTRMMRDIETIQKAGAERSARYRVIGKLAQVASARAPYQVHFQTYVLRSILSDVIEAANHRLLMMSRGRYRLVHGEGGAKNKWWGLEIDVFDEYTGLPRVARTLSGGETFLASLALALGLSDVVQHYAGGMHLDMIFIDEGFGSLDSETLDVAICALLDVQREGGRLVGIISHVEELRARIPVHLEITRTETGSRARFVQGGGAAL